MSAQSLQYIESNSSLFLASRPKNYSSCFDSNKDFDLKISSLFLKSIQFLAPLIILPYGMFKAVKAGCKKLACVAFYPSPLTTIFNRAERNEFKESLKSKHGGESIAIQTPDGAKLDGMLLPGKEKKAVIYCVGWNSYYECPERFEMIHRITREAGDINLALFNPRGVGESEGIPSAEKLALDLYSVFQYLVKVKGIDPSDIVIYGHSLGAAYGTLGAALIQREYPDAKINLISERSFADYGKTLRGLFDKHLPDWPQVAIAIGNFVTGAMQACKWSICVKEEIESLKGRVCIVYNKEDEAIPFHCSIYRKKKKRGKELTKPIHCIELFEPDAVSSGVSPHTRPLTQGEISEIANELKTMLSSETFNELGHESYAINGSDSASERL